MATWEQARWEPRLGIGLARSDASGGRYWRYVPDPVDGAALTVSGPLSRRVAEVERAVRNLNGPGAEGLAGIARFLLRSEAIASSRIEGIAPSAQQVALAELGQSETVRGVRDQARMVANNMTVVRRSTTELVALSTLTVEHLVDLQRALLPDQPQHHGLRDVQNWIGHSDWTPADADFVPPAPERVPALMADLVGYMNGANHSSLIQAAVVHGQFETIHPFTDGNGRVGRALVHTMLARRGLAEDTVLPISLVLATLRDAYVGGLTAYRHGSAPGSAAANAGIEQWVATFVEAASLAVEQSTVLARKLRDLRVDWDERLWAYRSSAGLRREPRSGSTVARLLDQLAEAPILTASSLSRILGVSYPAASSALDELRNAGIVQPKAIDRGATAYLAREVLDLVTLAERTLASTRFDTRASRPNRPVPDLPR